MTRPLVVIHGWGYDGSVWDALVALLPERPVLRAEAGYLGGPPHWPAMPPGAVLVGHSAGVLELLRRGVPDGCAGMVAINGFSRFAASDGFPGVPDRVLSRMEQGLTASPGAVLAAFRRRCGDPDPDPGRAEATRLAAGLRALRGDDARAALRSLAVPVLALAASDDPIVSGEHTRACFGAEALVWSDAGGHLLPLSRPDWCAAMIRDLAG